MSRPLIPYFFKKNQALLLTLTFPKTVGVSLTPYLRSAYFILTLVQEKLFNSVAGTEYAFRMH